jgi:hypothetical protein
MPYIQRDSTGRITGLFGESQENVQEWLDSDSAELQGFLHSLIGEGSSETLYKLFESDQSLIRVVEDLVDTLIGKDLLHFTDLPDAAQAKLLERRTLRRSVNALNLFREDDQQSLI